MEKYYINKINSLKIMKKSLGIIPIPLDTPLYFIISNIILSIIIEITIGTYFISAIIAFFICYDVYRKNKIKLEMLEFCLIEEMFMEEELERNGVGEFENDSIYVTDEDRDYIFKDSLYILKNNRFLNKIKNHHKFLSYMAIFYSIIYISMEFYLS